MAKLKAAGKKPKVSDTKGLIPCLLLIISGVLLITIFFYYSMKSA